MKKKKTKVRKSPSKTTLIIAKYFSIVSLLLLIGMGLYFYNIFGSFPMFPKTWSQYLLYGLIGVWGFLGIFCIFPKFHHTTKMFVMIVNIQLAICIAFASWYLPHIRAQIEKTFAEVPLEGEAEINFYVLKDEFKPNAEGDAPVIDNNGVEGDEDAHAEVDNDETGETEVEKVFDIKDYADATFVIQVGADLENQEYALLVLKRELKVDDVKTILVESIFDAVDVLNSGEGDVMVMNATYIPMVEDITGYEEFSSTVDVAYTVYKKLQISNEANSVDVTTKPFNILIVGNDAYGEVYTTGRTDVNMIATVNPVTKQVSFVTIPRDGYVPNARLNANDKLTHAGVYGVGNTEESIERYLGIEINYYVVINFSSLTKIVDAMGGIDIYNPYTFSTSSFYGAWRGTFEEGNIHLDGQQALTYCRERKNLPNGDFGRGEHQTIVIKAMVEKLTEPSIITKIDQLLMALEGTFKTNLSIEEIHALAQMQLDDMAMWNIVNYAMSGSTGYDYCASMGYSRTYSVVYIYEKHLTFVKNVIRQITDGYEVTQEAMP